MPRPKKNKNPLPSIPVETPSRQLLQESRKALLLDSDSDGENDDFQSVAASPALKVNEEYARRFEHNKKREELQRCRFLHPLASPRHDLTARGVQ